MYRGDADRCNSRCMEMAVSYYRPRRCWNNAILPAPVSRIQLDQNNISELQTIFFRVILHRKKTV